MTAVNPVVATLDEVFAGVPHTMFCAKGLDGRYVAVNRAFADRAGAPSVAAVLGHTAAELFPADLAESYEAQDQRVLATGEPIRNQLEMILRPDGTRGWYVTTKTRLVGHDGEVVGVVAVSYDLHAPARPAVGMADGATPDRHQRLRAAIDLARTRFAERVTVAELADAAGMSVTQLDRAMRRALGLSPKQLLVRARLDEAIRRLEDGDLPLATIASECGWYDQSSFTRQFRAAVGMTPGAYRAQARRHLRNGSR